jgi:hypothetical protein
MTQETITNARNLEFAIRSPRSCPEVPTKSALTTVTSLRSRTRRRASQVSGLEEARPAMSTDLNPALTVHVDCKLDARSFSKVLIS